MSSLNNSPQPSLSPIAPAAVRKAPTWLWATLLLAGCGQPTLLEADATIIRLVDGGQAPDAGRRFSDSGIGAGGLTLARLAPDHGPFIGGNQVVLRGNGFGEESQVNFDGRDVQPAEHRLIDPRRLSVVVPAGEPGTVDVEVTVDGVTVSLEDAYTYDRIYVEPNRGAVSGGTIITLIGSETDFQEGDEIVVGRTACTDVVIVSPTRLTCRTPPAVAGSVDVTVTDADGVAIAVEDGFNYYDSSDPFSGGLGGGPVGDSINLTVIDAQTGMAVPDAFAILGEDLETLHQGLTDSLGQVTFSGPTIDAPATIHIAKHCYEKTSVVSFDASDVTVFLVPWQDPMCGMGDPPPGGGRGRFNSFITGELIWRGPNEMGPNPWLNLPEPREGFRRVAYVYTTQRTLTERNPNPAGGGAAQRVLEESPGTMGYPYSIAARPAGLAVYALAGMENAVSGQFIPYVMGVARSVLTAPGQTLEGVDLVMDIPLDHYLEVNLAELPNEVEAGPDRFNLMANIDLGGEGVIVRNVFGDDLDIIARRSASRTFRFVAQPSLEGALSDGRYRVEAGWVTSDFADTPFTYGVENGVTAIDETLEMGGFLGIPVATSPEAGAQLPADRILRWEADGPEPDLQMVMIQGADGNPAWRMFLPGNVHEAPIPDLASIEGLDDMPRGFITWLVYSIRIPGFSFDEFSYRYLSNRYWSRWSLDVFTAQR